MREERTTARSYRIYGMDCAEEVDALRREAIRNADGERLGTILTRLGWRP